MIPDKYKHLTPGQIYIVFENNEILTKEEADPPKYKSFRTGKPGNRRGSSHRVSKNGNGFITKVGICEVCGEIRESKNLLIATCPECARDLRAIAKGRKPRKVKKKKVKEELSALQIAFNITGDFRNTEAYRRTIGRNYDVVASWRDKFFDVEFNCRSLK